jgi:ribonuclease R
VEAVIRRDGTNQPYCEIIRVFGREDSREANYLAILSECTIPTEFTDEELAAAERLAQEPISSDGRVDLRGETIFTIDSEGAKDLDDAVSLRLLPGGGYRLGVHIADVSHYVTERTPLDRCAMARGCSVYFTDKVVPMLPPALSNGACSLNSGEDKYTLSAIIDLDGDGNIKKTEIKNTIINSCVRGVYSEVNELLSGSADVQIRKKYAKVKPTLEKMRRLYEILLKKSQGRGAIDFDADEAVIVLGDDGTPTEIIRRERGLGERMIEQFMLCANEAVATYLTERGIPCVYRVHENPPDEGFRAFLDYLESLGFDVRSLRKSEPTPKLLCKILETADERGMLDAVSYTMLRAMAKAKYSEVRHGHFGLGIENYCHFTSPIRRLSDLATHRIIKKVILEGKRAENYASYARRAAAAATEGELRALMAERRIEDLYKVIYMSDRVGEEFDATVNSITNFGMFVSLENTCEGLVPISELAGLYTFDERNLTLRSRYKTYRMADRLRVRLEEANISRGKLRFSVIGDN